MHILSTCVLVLLSSVAVSWAAPAPFVQSRPAGQPLSVSQLERRLSAQHSLSVESIEPTKKRGEWIVVGTSYRSPYLAYADYLPDRYLRATYLVKFQGRDHEGRPQLALVAIHR